MSQNSTSATDTLCPNCGRGHLERRLIDEEFEFGTEDGPVRVRARAVPVDVCPQCDERFSGPEAARVEHAAICEALGLLTPAEIRAIREKLGMTQAEFARLTGFGEATISRWERGRLLQNVANDRFLRLLAGVPESRAFLASLAAT